MFAADYRKDGCGVRLDERRGGETSSAVSRGGGELSPVGVPVLVWPSLWPFCSLNTVVIPAGSLPSSYESAGACIVSTSSSDAHSFE